jgi:hypothetical protein
MSSQTIPPTTADHSAARQSSPCAFPKARILHTPSESTVLVHHPFHDANAIPTTIFVDPPHVFSSSAAKSFTPHAAPLRFCIHSPAARNSPVGFRMQPVHLVSDRGCPAEASAPAKSKHAHNS